MKEWIVDIKVLESDGSFEISVLKSTFNHGKISYGWFGPDKLLISSSHGANGSKAQEKMIFDKLVKVANEVCEELNNE